jgi:hypothetical protein
MTSEVFWLAIVEILGFPERRRMSLLRVVEVFESRVPCSSDSGNRP